MSEPSSKPNQPSHKKQPPRQPTHHQDTNLQSATEHSDIENFSELIAFNNKKDKQNLELNELEVFINHQYKKNKESKEEDNGGSSSDDDGTQQPQKDKSRLPYIRAKKNSKPP